MADVKLNSLATKTNANAAAILVKDSATQNQGAEGWITKAQLNQIIRDEVKAQLSAITSGYPDVPVLDGSILKYMTLANFAKVVGGLNPTVGLPSSNDANDIKTTGIYLVQANTSNIPAGFSGALIVIERPNAFVVQIYMRPAQGMLMTPKYRLFWNSAWTDWWSEKEQSSAITSGDLDDYKTTGEYTISSASIAQTVSNTPVNIGGRLIVKQFVGATSVLQTYIAYAATPSVYLRRFNSSAWDSWIQLQRVS